MAKILNDFDFAAPRTSSRYPWADWTDGKIRELTKGDDFTCDPSTLVLMARKYAKKNGLTANVSGKKGGDKAVVQFVKSTAPTTTGATIGIPATPKRGKNK